MAMYGIYNAETLKNLKIQFIKCIILQLRMKDCKQVSLAQHTLRMWIKMEIITMK